MKNTFFLIVFTLLLFACSKEENPIDVNSNIQESAVAFNCDPGDIGYLSLNEGEMHNQLVDLIIQNWTICSNDIGAISAEINRILNNDAQAIVEQNNMDYNEFKNVLNSMKLDESMTDFRTPGFNINAYLSTLTPSSTLNSKLVGISNIVDQGSGGTVASIQNSLCNYYAANHGDLSKDENLHFGAMTDVAMASTEFWSDHKSGGLNKFNSFAGIRSQLCSTNNTQPRAWPWSRIILADAAGLVAGAASAVAASGGAAAIPNPALGGLPTASLVGLIQGAGQSATAAIP